MDSTLLIENTAYEFWTLVGEVPLYPCNIQAALTLTLPLEVYPVASLRTGDVLAWAKRVNIAYQLRGRDRRLHGCLIADSGKGTIFVDTNDTAHEQRFTVAHELAHFLLDYQAPRQRAISILGPSILPVLDGLHPPTLAERLHAVLSTVPLGVMSHLMERPDDGLPSHIIIDSEDRADRLALELLAPAAPLFDLLKQPTAPRGFTTRLTYITQQLHTIYGLPESIAASYGRYLLNALGEPNFRDWLFDSTV